MRFVTAVHGRRRAFGIAVSALLVVLAGVLSAVSSGSASGSGLSFLDCISASAAPAAGCSATANLSGATGIAVTASGQNVYVASSNSRAIAVFARGSDGKLTPAGCLGNSLHGPGNCTPVADLDVLSLVVSPDERNLYAVGLGTLSIISRGANGAIATMGCVEDFKQFRATGDPHCAQTANLSGADAIAISPDGNDIYVGSFGSAAVEVFSRGPSGALTAAGCIGDAEDGPGNCTKVAGLGGVLSLAMSPDGKNLYAGSGNSISVLDRDANGAIHSNGCVRNIGSGPVTCQTQASLGTVEALAVSPDGKTLYAAATDGDDVEAFSRGADGGLTEIGCIGNVGTGPKGCTGVVSLNAPRGVLVAADSGGGKSVYVSSSAAVQAFSVGSDGKLTSAGCVVSDKKAAAGCDTATALANPVGLAVSPGAGSNLYVADALPGALIEFKRSPTVGPSASTSTAAATTTTAKTKPKKPPKPAITAQIRFASVVRSKQGKLVLQVGLHVSKSVTAKVSLVGMHNTVLASATSVVTGNHAVSVPLGASVKPGLKRVIVVLHDRQKNQKTLTTGTVVPK